MNLSDDIKRDCADYALHSFATAYIYSLRATRLERWLKFNTTLGILIPGIIGGMAAGYTGNLDRVMTTIQWLTPLGIVQLVLSIIILSYGLESNRGYYVESSIHNRKLFEELDWLRKYGPSDENELKHLFEKIIIDVRARNDSDDKYPFSDKENRKGMRHALRQFQRPCATCHEIPKSMAPTQCDTCGNF